jgi:hypothetical protein
MNALLLYRPRRIFGVLSVVCLVVALAWGLYPLEFYFRNQRLEEWMIYRVLLCAFLGTCAFMFTGAGVLSEQILSLVYRRRWRTFFGQWSEKLFSDGALAVFIAVACAAALACVWPGLVDYLSTGHTTLHWSRAIVAVYLMQLSVLAGVMMILRRIVNLWREQIDYAARMSVSNE